MVYSIFTKKKKSHLLSDRKFCRASKSVSDEQLPISDMNRLGSHKRESKDSKSIFS